MPDQNPAGAITGATALPPTPATLRVEEGTVDLFALSDSGLRLPLATLHAGEAGWGPAVPARAIAVPRQGARAVIDTDAPWPGVEQLGRFAQRLAERMGALATPLSTCSPEQFAETFAEAIATAQEQEHDTRLALAQAGLAGGQRAMETVHGRLSSSAETLRAPLVAGSAHPIVGALTLLGNAEGFTVTSPTPEALRTTKDPLRLIAHTSGLRYRQVHFSPGWQETSRGGFFAALRVPGGPPLAVAITRGPSGYRVQAAADPAPRPLTDELLQQLTPIGFEFYAPLPQERAASVRDVLGMAVRGMTGLWGLAALMALGVALLGMLTPVLTNLVINSVIPSGESRLLVQIGGALIVAASLCFVFTIVQNFTVSLISQRATRTAQSAMWDRVLSLPAGFFRRFSSGDLTVRVLAVNSLTALLSSQVVSAMLAAIFGMVNLVLMFYYDVMLGIVGAAFLLLTVGVLLLSVRVISRHASETLAAQRQANGWMVQMLSGIMKIRMANAEPQMEAQYLDIAGRQAVAASRQTLAVGRINAWFVFAASAASALFYLVILLQWEGAAAPISTANYMAFSSAYGLAFAAIAGLASLISPLANAGPTFDLLRPIMQELPETSGDRQDPGTLSGRIELRDVHFRYTPDGPMVLKGLDLKIEPGTMVALVGPSGAGKSTITRLLLGFDVPEQGQVLFDGRDLQNLDPTMVRSQMGVVVQEGRITRGSIMRNILGAGVHDEALAWQAAEKAALAEDIRQMPMRMETVVDPNNVSGGQAQRILLARALVRNPSVLILDEATSALDNASQKVVTEAMQALHATRVVIAHRLSTIRSADRIIVMKDGQAVESGTFDELLAAGGVFTALVNRQMA